MSKDMALLFYQNATNFLILLQTNLSIHVVKFHSCSTYQQTKFPLTSQQDIKTVGFRVLMKPVSLFYNPNKESIFLA